MEDINRRYKKNIRLSSIKESDKIKLCNILNEENLTLYSSDRIPVSVNINENLDFINRYTKIGDSYLFGIYLEEEIIGFLGLFKMNSIYVELGLSISEKYWSFGYGKEAIELALRFVFNFINTNKVKLHVYDFNERAIRCYEKLGFKREGTLRQEVYKFGALHDIHIYGILREEFNSIYLKKDK